MTSNRYALTLRLMLANLRKHKKTVSSPGMVSSTVLDVSLRSMTGGASANVTPQINPESTAPYTPEELGMNWSAHLSQYQIMPSTIPFWLQEGVSAHRELFSLQFWD
jgi:hypothetical protein